MDLKYLNCCQIFYGYAHYWGWRGIGRIFQDPDSPNPVIWFEDDTAIMSEDEIIYNDFMRMNILEVIGTLPDNDVSYVGG